MSGLDNLQTRLNYMGGNNQQDRMVNDKLRSLKKSLLYSYQAETAILEDGREFRCLINPDNLKPDYDNKIISIPFEDICLNKEKIGTTTEGIEEIGLKSGDVFQWKENNTYWIVYSRYLEELAYFRAEIRRCDQEVEINGHTYHIYFKGPQETTIVWAQKAQVEWNDLNYKPTLYITKNEETLDFFHRFTKIKIDEKQYQVTVVNPYKVDGIIQVELKEFYTNSIEDEGYHEPTPIEPPEQGPRIIGNSIVQPYDTITYQGEELPDGYWEIDNLKKAKIIEINKETFKVTIEIITGKSGNFNLLYKDNNNNIIVTLPIIITSL